MFSVLFTAENNSQRVKLVSGSRARLLNLNKSHRVSVSAFLFKTGITSTLQGWWEDYTIWEQLSQTQEGSGFINGSSGSFSSGQHLSIIIHLTFWKYYNMFVLIQCIWRQGLWAYLQIFHLTQTIFFNSMSWWLLSWKMLFGMILPKTHSSKNILGTLENGCSSQFWTSFWILNRNKNGSSCHFHFLVPMSLSPWCSKSNVTEVYPWKSSIDLEIDGRHEPT